MDLPTPHYDWLSNFVPHPHYPIGIWGIAPTSGLMPPLVAIKKKKRRAAACDYTLPSNNILSPCGFANDNRSSKIHFRAWIIRRRVFLRFCECGEWRIMPTGNHIKQWREVVRRNRI